MLHHIEMFESSNPSFVRHLLWLRLDFQDNNIANLKICKNHFSHRPSSFSNIVSIQNELIQFGISLILFSILKNCLVILQIDLPLSYFSIEAFAIDQSDRLSERFGLYILKEIFWWNETKYSCDGDDVEYQENHKSLKWWSWELGSSLEFHREKS